VFLLFLQLKETASLGDKYTKCCIFAILDSPLLLYYTPKTLKKMIVKMYSSSDPNIVQNYYITRLKP